MVIGTQLVASVSQPSARMAPTSVRLRPQFMGRGSISSVPRGSHACERPIAKMDAGFIEKHEPLRIYGGGPVLEGGALVADVRTILFRGP